MEQSHQDRECASALLPLQCFVALPARDDKIFIDASTMVKGITLFVWTLTMQGRLVEKICRYLSAAAIRHTTVVRAFNAHRANRTFWNQEYTAVNTVKSTQRKFHVYGL